MKNKSLAIAAAILLSTGIAFSFSSAGKPCCAQENQSCEASAKGACCDMQCPIEDCLLPCCGK